MKNEEGLYLSNLPFWTCLYLSQNINLYLTLLEKGRTQEVKDNLPELLDRYPDS